jgi:uncharacterized RDD family membrane protein YckC
MRPAEGGRRGIAAMVDFGLGAAVSGWIFGIDPLAIAGLTPAAASTADILPLLTAMAIGCGHSTLCEWLLGRSIGKALSGCRVIRVVTASEATLGGPSVPGRPRLWQAIVRNLVRWGAPPITVFAMSDRLGRHPGDLAAGTVVVVADEAPQPPPKPGNNP